MWPRPVENQVSALTKVAEARGWQIVGTFSDKGISGAKTREERPGLDDMLKRAQRREFDVVMAWAIDRIGRSLIVEDIGAAGGRAAEALFPLAHQNKFLSPSRKSRMPAFNYTMRSLTLYGPGEGTGRRGVSTMARAALILAVSESHTLEGGRTVLLPVQEGDIWRVQIVWPNGQVHYFGRFASKKHAVKWISAHQWWATYKEPPKDGGE
jgi:Resolvase, N terminal domain